VLLSFSFRNYRVKNLKKKTKTLQRNISQSYNVLLDIAAALRGLAHYRSSSALSTIAAPLRDPTRCHSSAALLAIVVVPRSPTCCYSSTIRTLQAPRVASQCRSNVTSCSAPSHRCSVARTCSVAPLPVIAATAAEFYTFDFGPSFDGLLLDIRPICVRRPSEFCLTFVQLSSDVGRTSIGLSFDLRPTSVRVLFDFRSTFVRRRLNFHRAFVRLSSDIRRISIGRPSNFHWTSVFPSTDFHPSNFRPTSYVLRLAFLCPAP